ncbi:MAG: exodeoxyribonuclease VII large subunit [Lachnospiraceae bacterium]|nr:exodeoxyribonuclease VII large subunit [Lachnospiraceae bacterium]
MAGTYSVFQVNRYIKGLMEDDLSLRGINVSGELSNVKYHQSGHIYFTLKDERAAIAGVMFASDAAGLEFRLKEGDSVIVRGNISVYERDGKYQIYAKKISHQGAGELYERFEKLKAKLEEMGMFSEEYKREIPAFVQRLGVVTAPTGAAVRDIINIATRRNPHIEIILYPAKVQGEGAAESVANGIVRLCKYEPDVIIVGRGGGSIEDLWAFNEEIVARTIFDCPIPVISGTGHETDFTIADFVADKRASTPSEAAELATFEYDSLMEELSYYRSRFGELMEDKLSEALNRIDEYTFRFRALSPESKMKEKRMRLLKLEDSLIHGMNMALNARRSRLSILAERLNGLSPLSSLSRGYTYTTDTDGRAIKDIDQVEVGDEIRVYLRNGRLSASVSEKTGQEQGR